jgi:hydroxyacylglutathione hydrolase
MSTKVIAIPAFKDNYIWAIHNPQETQVIVVDPGDAAPVLAYLQQNNLTLKAILLTHHHWDHSGGIPVLVDHFPTIPVYGPANEKEPIAGVNQPIKENDEIAFADFSLTLKVIDIPGHTLGHIAFFGNEMLFCGDTLFACGCGRIFEGTPEQMAASLEKIKNLPKNTLIYCGHEYTLANIRFAKAVEPSNNALLEFEQISKENQQKNQPTLPTMLQQELATNPFLRCDQQSVISAVQQHGDNTISDPVSIFAQLRRRKNEFTG